jgi:RimJ/RimL family protein N-acetyltransferase
MYIAQGRFCYLEELTTENDKELFELMKNNKDEYRFLISDEPVPETYEEFQNRLNIWFTHGRNYQFLVKKDNKTVGTIFFYGLNPEKKSVKLSAYFIPEVRKTPLVGEALGLILNFALEILKVEKIEFSVYKENKVMLEMIEKNREFKDYFKRIGESPSSVNPERTIINFEISLEYLNKINEKLREFYKRRLR